MTFLGILFGLMWFRLNDDDIAGMNSKLSAVFMAVGFGGVMNSDTALPVMYRLREVFYRERASNTYHHAIYSSLLGIVEIPYVFGTCVCFLIPFYFLVGFANDATAFFKFLFTLFLVALAFCYMGQFFSVLMPNLILANVAQGFILTFLFLFAGVFISVSAIPVGWIWVYYINPLPKGIISIGIAQYACHSQQAEAGAAHADAEAAGTGGAGCPSLFDPVTDQWMTKSAWTGRYMQTDMSQQWYWYYNAWLGFTILVLRFLVFICVKYINHQKR